MATINTITVTYSYSESFNNGLQISQLSEEIMSSGLPYGVYNIKRRIDDVIITLVSDQTVLPPSDKNILDDIVDSHVPVMNENVKMMQMIVGNTVFGNKYTRMISFQTPYTNFNLLRISIIAHTNTGSYSIKIIDQSGLVVVEKTNITNQDDQIIILSPVNFSNVHNNDIWEFQVKGSHASSKVEVSSILLTYTDDIQYSFHEY